MKKFTIYTDGSHFKSKWGSGRLGIGGILVDENNREVNKFSTEITPQYLEMYYKTSDCSNPTMEMLAVLQALQRFKSDLKNADEVVVKADYNGVMYWMRGEWKINKNYIYQIKRDIDQEIKRQQLRISFEWVPSHQRGNTPDIYWNNRVDLLSKGEDHD